MKTVGFLLALTLLASITGCRQLPTRTLPVVPKLAASPDATGEQKVMLQMMQEMAEADAGSIRK